MSDSPVDDDDELYGDLLHAELLDQARRAVQRLFEPEPAVLVIEVKRHTTVTN